MMMMMTRVKSWWRLGEPGCICQVAKQFNQDYPGSPNHLDHHHGFDEAGHFDHHHGFDHHHESQIMAMVTILMTIMQLTHLKQFTQVTATEHKICSSPKTQGNSQLTELTHASQFG